MLKKLALSLLTLTILLPAHGTDSWWKTAQDYNADTIASFVIPASITYYFMNKETLEERRQQAQLVVDLWKAGILTTMNSLEDALTVLRLDDKALARKMWWEKMGESAAIGLLSAALYYTIVYSKDDVVYAPHIHWNVGCRTFAAPPCRG